MPHHFCFTVLILPLVISAAFGRHQSCSFDSTLCRGNTNRGHPRRHDSPEFRGLTGDHLHSQIAGLVPENTMRCFTYKMRSCDEGSASEETCLLRPYQKARLPVPIDSTTRSDTKYLQSPRFSDTLKEPDLEWGSRFFCIYNVSLSCPESSAVKIDLSKFHNTWPKNSEGCQNYVDFYSSKNSDTADLEYCGGTFDDRILESTSFLAILWNSAPRYVNKGNFNFQVTCAAPSITTATQQPITGTSSTITGSSSSEKPAEATQEPAVGSGDADILLAQNTN